MTGVTGSGASYTVTASTGSGTGTLGLKIPSAGTIADQAGNPLAGTPVNGPAYTIAPQPYSLFAADASCSKTGINVGGGSNTFGAAHSNGAFTVSGSSNSFGTSDAGCTPSISGKNNTFGRNGASTPSSGPNNLPFPETYNQTTVCSQPGAHTGTTFTITNSSSGIYCATSQITFGSSNVTATVTLVAPTITFSGSGLNLTPAYSDLLAYDTSTTLGNTGITFSGGNDTFHKGTVYDPYGLLTYGGSGSTFDGFFEADTITISGSNNTFTGEGPASYLTVSGNASAPVWPGGSPVPIPLTFTNANNNAQTVTSLTVTIQSGIPSGCAASDFTITASNVSPATPLNVPGHGSVTLPAQGVTAPTIQLADNGNQNACEGATLTLGYTATDTFGPNTGTATVGTPTPFTVTVGAPSGGPLLPTSATDPNRTVDTVQVTVTNNDPGAEYLHQITYKITPAGRTRPAARTRARPLTSASTGSPSTRPRS